MPPGNSFPGEVMLVRHKREGTVYAMKMLRKDNVVKRNQANAAARGEIGWLQIRPSSDGRQSVGQRSALPLLATERPEPEGEDS